MKSKSRKYISGKEQRLFSSGKAAFRFLLPRKIAELDPITKPLVERTNCLDIWYGDDRRVVCYPCNDNLTLNFVLIHPESESCPKQVNGELNGCSRRGSDVDGMEWNKTGSVEQALGIYGDFDPALKALISKVNPTELKVWRLFDMEPLETFYKGRLVLIGDAAHPFMPCEFTFFLPGFAKS
jgi:2-polyprenyl-6-methoxyphenol hydroxylase-like FAD-dependent oxidoreductase